MLSNLIGLPPEQVEAGLARLTPAQLARALELTRGLHKIEAQKTLYRLFPDETGEALGVTYYSRDLYPRHMEFFEAGSKYRERLFLAGNRTGKSVAGAFETALHLTGDYPDWWPGRRFKRAISAWVAGDTNETTRDIIQATLLGAVAGEVGKKEVSGTGIIPGDRIGRPTWKRGVADFVDSIPIRHKTGAWSQLGFKSYDQGRRAFQGTAKHLIWLDEECPEDVYDECLTRTATTNGLMMLTFTPLQGLTPLVLSFVGEINGDS